MKPVLYRYRDSESVIRAMDGYTPGEGWTPLYDQSAMQVEEEPLATNRKEFWDGFWGVFRHPVTIYCFGFTAGVVTCELLKLAH